MTIEWLFIKAMVTQLLKEDSSRSNPPYITIIISNGPSFGDFEERSKIS